MIDQATIDRIMEAAQIEQVVSDYVSLRKRGVNLIGLCPFHNEKTPSFTVSPAKGICKCFGCGKGGNSVNFVMEIEQLNYYEALKHLAKKYNIEVIEKELTPEQKAQQDDRESMLVVNAYAQKYFSNNLHEHIDGKAIGLAYFKERGFSDEIIKKFQLGYSLEEKEAFTQAALKNGYKQDYLQKTGLTIENDQTHQLLDRFRGRVMFPIHSLSGKVVAFGGRILRTDAKIAKYLNSPESDVYHKSAELYGIFFAKQAIVKHERCFLVEGYTDVMSMHQAGIENVVASSGTSLTQGQIRLIHRFTPNVTVIFDGDAAGIKASLRGIDMLLEQGMNIKVVSLPEGEDPDSFAKKQNASEFIDFINNNSVDFIRFKTNLLLKEAGNDPIRKAKLISDIVTSISVIPDNIIRTVYIRECSDLMNIDEKTLYNEINKIKRTKREKELGVKLNENRSSFTSKAPMPETKKESKTPCYYEELSLLHYFIRYGNIPLYYYKSPEEAEKVEYNPTVIEYLYKEFESDNLFFHNPLHALVFETAKQEYKKENFVSEYFFLNHPNPAISQLALDIATDKYKLTENHSKQLPQENQLLNILVNKAIHEFKIKIIINRIKTKLEELKKANQNQDQNRVEELMNEINILNQTKAEISKHLGKTLL